jgi:hypothetical protein
MTTRLPDFYLGTPLRLRVIVTPHGTATTPCYLVFDSTSLRLRRTLKFVPGASDNDGVMETRDGVVSCRFFKPAEWSRDTEVLPAGEYFVWAWIGPIVGVDGRAAPLAPMSVRMPGSGAPLFGEGA